MCVQKITKKCSSKHCSSAVGTQSVKQTMQNHWKHNWKGKVKKKIKFAYITQCGALNSAFALTLCIRDKNIAVATQGSGRTTHIQ